MVPSTATPQRVQIDRSSFPSGTTAAFPGTATARRATRPEINKAGAMMLAEGFVLPSGIESLDYSSTWRTLVDVDSFGLSQKLHDAGLHLFFIAGESKVVELGHGKSAARRAANRILAQARKKNLNCVEIKQIVPARLLGLPYIVVHAGSFHIQRGTVLQSNSQRKSEQQGRDWAHG
jgi:hypothetical protein